ncbi:MAG TPA: hypothetical protein VLW52_16575 [Opitutaceae bacterium]|nr:hypothetical protein [Opitutaceae bacterium]
MALGWILLLPSALSRFVRERTGFGVECQTLYLNPFAATVALRGLTITNPPGFPRKDFIDLRGFRARARLFSLFGRRPVIDEAVVDVAGITLVKDAQGVINARVFQQGWTGSSRGQASSSSEAGRRREFLVRRLQIRCDRLVIADYSKRTPDVREFDLNLSRTYENVTCPKDLAAPLADVLAPVAGVIGGVLPEAGLALRGASDKVVDTGRKTGEAVKGLFEALEKSLKK